MIGLLQILNLLTFYETITITSFYRFLHPLGETISQNGFAPLEKLEIGDRIIRPFYLEFQVSIIFGQDFGIEGLKIRNLAPGVKPRGTKSALEGGNQQKEVMPSMMPLW